MQIAFHEPLRDHKGRVIVAPANGRTVPIALGNVASVALMRFRGPGDVSERYYDLAVRIMEQLDSDDPQPIEVGEDVSVREIQDVIDADLQLEGQFKVPARRALMRQKESPD